MIIGVVKEIKNREYRVGLTPSAVREVVANGHQVLIETNAGATLDLTDQSYQAAGATIVGTAAEIFAKAEMIVKVKEPQSAECKMLRPGQILFTYLHLAPDAAQTDALMASGATAIAYETVEDKAGRLPLLTPMSEVAGRLSIQIGAHYLEKTQGGRGLLLGGVPGVAPANVVVLGGGVVGTHAARMAVGLGAHVIVVDKNLVRLNELDVQFGSQITTLYSTIDSVERICRDADLVIGAVLLPGAEAPRVVKKDWLKNMKKGAVLVDVSIDQGGCFETSRPTSHDDPIYEIDGIIHYCVTNMPGAVARTSTFALNNATLPYVLELANKGLDALKNDPGFLKGLNVYKGQLTYKAVANAQNKAYCAPQQIFQ